MPTHNPSNPDVEGCFEVTLARGLNMARKRLPIRTALSKHKRRFFSLADHKRYDLAAALQWEYRRRSSWLKGDERALRILNDQYSNAQYFVTPIHGVPFEILMEIFRIVFDDHAPPFGLMLVCHRWLNVINAMSGFQSFVELRTWTAPDIVRHAVSGMQSRLLNITVDTDQDREFEMPLVERYSAFAMAVENTSQWRSLTVHSLPWSEQLADPTLHKILSNNILPMSRLVQLKITSEVEPSPLVDHLLRIIGATAMGGLMTMETSSLYAIKFLLHATSTYTFHSLTTLKAVLPKLSEPINIFPQFSKLEVLEAINLSLPLYQSDSPLPLSQTLCRLYLKSGTIEWMAGLVFPLLTVCTIITPSSPFLALDVHLPTCLEFHFHHQSTALLGRFQIPIVNSLVVGSNHWTPLQGSQGLVDMCMAGLGTVLRPRMLHLAILCNGSMLRMVLQDLPALEELTLELPRPSALGRGFFTSLLARPATIPHSTLRRLLFQWAERQNDWHAAVCPSLRVFNLHYQRWVRPSEQLGFVAPLLALGWTRKRTAVPLQTSCVHIKASEGNWKRVELVPVKPKCLIELNIPQLNSLKLGSLTHELVFQAYLTSAALSAIDACFAFPMDVIPHLTEAVFGTYFYRIRVLNLENISPFGEIPTLNVLHCFHQLEHLSLWRINISLYPHDVDLPLLRTLQTLYIDMNHAQWLDGHTFVKLTSFSTGATRYTTIEHPFPNRVYMPVCARISLICDCIRSLPVFQAALASPLVAEWNLESLELRQEDFRAARGATHPVVHALNKIHAQVLRLTDAMGYRHLIAVIQLIYELEELSIKFRANIHVADKFLIALTEMIVDNSQTINATKPSFDAQTIRTRTIATNHTCHDESERKIICPNLRVLDLKFSSTQSKKKGEIRQWCVQMMEGRSRAGYPLDRCRIWWYEWHREDVLSLVLFTSNEGIIFDE